MLTLFWQRECTRQATCERSAVVVFAAAALEFVVVGASRSLASLQFFIGLIVGFGIQS